MLTTKTKSKMDERIPVMNEEVQCDIIDNRITLLLEKEGIDLIVEKKDFCLRRRKKSCVKTVDLRGNDVIVV